MTAWLRRVARTLRKARNEIAAEPAPLRSYRDLDPSMHAAAVAHLQSVLDPFTKRRISEMIEEHGSGDWASHSELSKEEEHRIFEQYGFCVPSPFHFGTGMAIRNSLRKHVARDDKVPSGNWDDHYVAVVEDAVR